jgi:hypothetical protein
MLSARYKDMLQQLKIYYEYLLTIPDRLYPFASEIEGRWVRGKESYARSVAAAFERYGRGRLGYKLTLYRDTFHFIGSVLFITAAAILSNIFLGSEMALYVLLGAAVLALSFQEFYVHPKHWEQHVDKSVLDWFSWIVPMMIYISFF